MKVDEVMRIAKEEKELLAELNSGKMSKQEKKKIEEKIAAEYKKSSDYRFECLSNMNRSHLSA